MLFILVIKNRFQAVIFHGPCFIFFELSLVSFINDHKITTDDNW